MGHCHSLVIRLECSDFVSLQNTIIMCYCFNFSQVDSAWAAGDRDGSRRLSSAARGWNIAGIVVGVVVYVCIIVSVVAVTVTANANAY